MAYMQLKQIGSSTWISPGPVNIGILGDRGSKNTVLIDSGNDKEAGRQLNKRIEEQDRELSCIINTHSNADHIGGNAFLQKKTGCRIAATAGEAPFIERPELEGAFLYGGFPYPGMNNKFLRAAPSHVTDIISSCGPIELKGDGNRPRLTALSLPGHYFDMIGIRTPDDIVFLADALFSDTIISKYHLFFIYDVAAYLNTLDMIEGLDADLFVPSHAEPVKDIRPLTEINRKKILEIAGFLLEICTERDRGNERGSGIEFDDILAAVCSRYAISLDANQYVLVSSTVRSYLSYLAGQGDISMVWKDGRMFWRKEAD